MKTSKSIRFVSKFTTIVSSLILSVSAIAGDNIEVLTNGNTVISHKLWDTSQFPLDWSLNNSGVINNNVTGSGGAVTNAQAQAAINQAFQAWQNITTSAITVAYTGETATANSGCDLLDIVTWSDTTQNWAASPDTIARGITWSYVGPDIVLDATNRTTIGCDAGTVSLPVADYPNGMTLRSGTILDMDMTWNPDNFDYVTAPNSTAFILDIQAVATHEFGHLFGFSHTSMAYTANSPATMYPIVSATNVTLQNNLRTLEADDNSSSGGYPDTGHWPGGAAAYSTGAISGSVFQPSGVGAGGVRVWAYNISETTRPVYESFTATQFDWDSTLSRGDYVIEGMLPGEYYLCILPWSNGVPTTQAANFQRYNATTTNGSGNTGFGTECFDDAASGANAPDFAETDVIRKVTVTTGATTANIDFVTGTQVSDFMLIMDRSGSMRWSSGTAGVTKLQALQNAANELIDYLDLSGGHRLGLVQFEEVLVPLTPLFNVQTLNAGSVGNAHTAIDTMSAGGWTNIIAGVNEGINQLTTVGTPNPRQIMLVFSDGKHNRPIGSDLNDINTPVVDNDISFYSVGFGTDVDDAVLSQVALNSGGIHVDEQDLSPLALSKHFLSIAASAADDTTLIDPRYQLGSGQTGKLAVPVTKGDHYMKFVVQWETRDQDLFKVSFTTPDGCKVSTEKEVNFSMRRGKTYQIVKVPLPFICGKQKSHEGVWQIEATNNKDISGQEKTDIIVFGHSRLYLYADTQLQRGTPFLIAKLLERGHVRRGMNVWAEILKPLPQTGDSEREDGQKDVRDEVHRSKIPKQKRIDKIKLFDDGRHGDGKAKDGIYGAKLAFKEVGVYQIRTIADYKVRENKVKREDFDSVYFDGKTITVNQIKPRGKLYDRNY